MTTEKKEVQLAYKGKRLNGKKWSHRYQVVGTSRAILFKDKLRKFDVIGDVLKCEETGSTVKPLEKIGVSNDELITLWSLEREKDIADYELLKLAKLKPSADILTLVNTIRNNTSSSIERRQIALHIYTLICR